jgi:hypothetical protein
MALLAELIELRRWADDEPDHPPSMAGLLRS